MSDSSPPIAPPPLPNRNRKYQEMARASWLAPLIAMAVMMVVQTIQVPLIPSAIQLGVAGPEFKRAEVDRLAETLLASLEGNTNW